MENPILKYRYLARRSIIEYVMPKNRLRRITDGIYKRKMVCSSEYF